MLINEHLDLLGMRCKDRISGQEGVVSSICFDLYGCIQAALTPKVKPDGSMGDMFWMDISRLDITDERPVMDRPNYVTGPVAEGKHGPADKPAPR